MRRALLWTAASLVLAFLLAPILIIVPMSFGSALSLEFPPRSLSIQWYIKYFTSPSWLDATWTSFEVALAVTALTAALGAPAAFGLVRGRFPGRSALFTLMLSPLVIPGIVVAVATYLLFARLELVGTVLGLILAHTIVALPLVVVNVGAVLQGFDRTVERAAAAAGADPWRTFVHITLPIIRPGFVAGALFAFMASFDEVIIAIFLSGPKTATLPKRMWDSVLLETDPTISAISTLLITATLLGLVIPTVRRRV